MRAARFVVAVGLAVVVGCGDTEDPFVGLKRVSGVSPLAPGCAPGQLGNNFVSVEVEPSLAIDPASSMHLVATWQQDRWSNGGARGIGTAVSFDGGATWMRSTPRFGLCGGGSPGNGADYERATDPWVTFAADGTVFQSALVFDSTTPRNAMVASRSSDGGVTWSDPTVLRADNDRDVFNDKDSITADPVDPGRVYAVWDRLTGVGQPTQPIGTGPTWFARTTAGVWEQARAIFDPGVDAQTLGNAIVVLPDGTLVDMFNLITQASSQAPVSTVAVIRSPDHGLTWSAPTLIAPMRGTGVQDPNNHVFVRTGLDLPQIAVDRGTGALYIVWEDARPGAGLDGIALVASRDGGMSWSPPMLINGAPAVAAFTPMVAVAGDGTVGVTYYDLREAHLADASTFRVVMWLATSHDGGATWSDEMVGEPFDLRSALLTDAYFIGDYQGLATGDGAFVPLFVAGTPDADNRTDVLVRPIR